MHGTLALCPSYAIKATSLACKGTETALFLVGSKYTKTKLKMTLDGPKFEL